LLAQDMHTRPEDLTNLMAKAEMELRRTTAQRRATTYMFVASIAAAVIRNPTLLIAAADDLLNFANPA
jgi:hypothetical protein